MFKKLALMLCFLGLAGGNASAVVISTTEIKEAAKSIAIYGPIIVWKTMLRSANNFSNCINTIVELEKSNFTNTVNELKKIAEPSQSKFENMPKVISRQKTKTITKST